MEPWGTQKVTQAEQNISYIWRKREWALYLLIESNCWDDLRGCDCPHCMFLYLCVAISCPVPPQVFNIDSWGWTAYEFYVTHGSKRALKGCLCFMELFQLRLMMWLCNDPATTKTLSSTAAIVSGLWQNTVIPPVEPVCCKGASVRWSPGTVRCTWIPLGVLAAEVCGRAPKKTVTHRQQMASVVFHPASLLLALSYKTLWATEMQKSLGLNLADMRSCPLLLQEAAHGYAFLSKTFAEFPYDANYCFITSFCLHYFGGQEWHFIEYRNENTESHGWTSHLITRWIHGNL